MTVYCANRDSLFEHSFVYHDTLVVCLHVCYFDVFCVGFISYLLYCWCLCKPCKRHWKCQITNIEQKWWITFVRYPKHDSKTLVRNRDRTNTTITNKNYCEFCSEKHKKYNGKYKCQNQRTKKFVSKLWAMIRLVLQNITNKKNACSVKKSNWPTLKVQTKISDKKNMLKLVLQNKQVCILKPHQKYSGKITKNMKSLPQENFGWYKTLD